MWQSNEHHGGSVVTRWFRVMNRWSCDRPSAARTQRAIRFRVVFTDACFFFAAVGIDASRFALMHQEKPEAPSLLLCWFEELWLLFAPDALCHVHLQTQTVGEEEEVEEVVLVSGASETSRNLFVGGFRLTGSAQTAACDKPNWKLSLSVWVTKLSQKCATERLAAPRCDLTVFKVLL